MKPTSSRTGDLVTGHYGRYCTEMKDPCQGNICAAGSCQPADDDGSDSEYTCTCDLGFTGKLQMVIIAVSLSFLMEKCRKRILLCILSV